MQMREEPNKNPRTGRGSLGKLGSGQSLADCM